MNDMKKEEVKYRNSKLLAIIIILRG